MSERELDSWCFEPSQREREKMSQRMRKESERERERMTEFACVVRECVWII